MKLFRSWREAMKMILSGYNMWIAVAASMVLAFTGTCFADQSGRAYSVFETMVFILGGTEITLQPWDVFRLSGLGYLKQANYLAMFLPIIAAFPAVPALLDEVRSGASRYFIHRSGRIGHYLGRVLAIWMSGGLAVMTGYLLAAVPVYLVFFSGAQLQGLAEAAPFYTGLGQILSPVLGEAGVLLSYALDMFFYGAFFALPACLLSGAVRNKYLVLCIPMILRFIYDTIQKKYVRAFWTEGNMEMLSRAESWGSEMLGSAASSPSLGKWLWILAGLAVTAVLYCLMMERRLDAGA